MHEVPLPELLTNSNDQRHGHEKSGAYRAFADPRVLPPVVTDSVYVDAVVMGAYC